MIGWKHGRNEGVWCVHRVQIVREEAGMSEIVERNHRLTHTRLGGENLKET